MDDDLTPFLPLAPAALHILLCLSAEARHGYGIMREVARQSDGQYQLGSGTLYDQCEDVGNGCASMQVGSVSECSPERGPRV